MAAKKLRARENHLYGLQSLYFSNCVILKEYSSLPQKNLKIVIHTDLQLTPIEWTHWGSIKLVRLISMSLVHFTEQVENIRLQANNICHCRHTLFIKLIIADATTADYLWWQNVAMSHLNCEELETKLSMPSCGQFSLARNFFAAILKCSLMRFQEEPKSRRIISEMISVTLSSAEEWVSTSRLWKLWRSHACLRRLRSWVWFQVTPSYDACLAVSFISSLSFHFSWHSFLTSPSLEQAEQGVQKSLSLCSLYSLSASEPSCQSETGALRLQRR